VDHGFRVVLAHQHQCFSHIPTLAHVLDDLPPQGALSFQKADVTDAEKPFLGAGQRYANSVFYLQETDFALFVASNK